MLGSGTDVLLPLARPEDCCFAGYLRRREHGRCLGCWQLIAHVGRERGESGMPFAGRCWRTNGRWRDVVGACNGLFLASWCGTQKEKRGGCPCCE